MNYDYDQDIDQDDRDYYGQYQQSYNEDTDQDNVYDEQSQQEEEEKEDEEKEDTSRVEYQDFYQEEVQIDDDLFQEQGEESGEDNQSDQENQSQQQEQEQENQECNQQQNNQQFDIQNFIKHRLPKKPKPISNLNNNAFLQYQLKLLLQNRPIDQLFNFSAYKPSTDIQFHQQRHVTYQIDQIKIFGASFGVVMATEKQQNNSNGGSQYQLYKDKDRVEFNGILRVRKQHKIGGVIELLSQNSYKLEKPNVKNELKIDIKVNSITKVILITSLNAIYICYEGAPQFYINIHLTPYENAIIRQKTTNLQKQRRYLTGFMLQNDLANGTLRLKHCNKRWERLKNYSLNYQQQNDLLMKYCGFKYGAITMCLNSSEYELNGLMKVLNKFKPIQLVKLPTIPPTFTFTKLRQKYSMGVLLTQLNYLKQKQKYNIQYMEIAFCLISMLYQCSYVTMQQIIQLTRQIMSIIKQSQLSKQKWNVLMIRQALISLNKQQLYFKMQNGTKLLNLFKAKFDKCKKRKNKFNYNDNIEVKALKITPSGLLPAGWTRDLRNRLVRQYKNYDFQFLKVQVTNDNQQKGRLFNGGSELTVLLNRELNNVSTFGYKYVPIGWTQSQLRTSSLWYTLQRNQSIPKNIEIISRNQFMNFLGEFGHIKNAALKAARIGQNLSTGKSINLQNVQIIYKNDDCSGKYLYTDGIGKISPDLIKKIKNQLTINGTALQIRFLGCKGILLINHQLKPNTIQIRESMNKFKCNHPDAGKYFDVLDYNFYKPGYLNRQIIILLEANGVPLEQMKNIQKQYIKNILEQGVKFQQIMQNAKGDFDLVNGFKQKLSNDFDPQKQVLENISDIIKYMSAQKKLQISNQPTLRGIIIEKYHEMFQRLIKKCQIKIQKSARILGVIDDYNILKENQVYCTILKDQSSEGLSRKGLKKKMAMLHKRIQIIAKQKRIHQQQQKNKQHLVTEMYQNMQMSTNNNPTRIKKQDLGKFSKQQIQYIKYWQKNKKKIIRQNISGKVMVTRNPCMHPADIRVVNCVSKQEVARRFKQKNWPRNLFQEITNCVIFPKSGKIPLTAQISGSDLDGDTFFITWDPRLIPAQSLKPFITDDQIKRQRPFTGNDFPHMIQFFSQFVFNNNLGRLANSHLVHADQDGAFSDQCIQLCKIHNQAVDYPKKGYNFEFPKHLWVKQFPHFMQKGKQKKSYRSASVLGELYDDAVGYYQQFCQKSRQFNYKLDPLKKCMSIKFKQKQIQEECKIVIEYNKQITKILKMYSMKRQFQLYTIQVSHQNKQNRSRIAFIDDLKLKYLKKLFKDTKQNPFKYIYELKSKKNNRFQNPQIIKRLLLWYMISYTELLQISNDNDKQIESQLGKNWITKVRKYLDGQKINMIGLCWFCAPYLTQMLLKNISRL